MDNILLLFLVSIIVLVIYRMIISLRLLLKKQNMIDEKYYVCFFYVSLVDVIMILSKNIMVGYILIAITPIILTLYVALMDKRIYWIINGYELTDATFNNKIKEINPEYEKITNLIDVISFEHKRKERKTKVIITSKNYEEKEKILAIIKSILKENVAKSNKIELIYLALYFVFFLILAFLVLIVLV